MKVIQKYMIDFEKIKPVLIEAFTYIYGEYNRELIEDRINKIILVQYINYYNVNNKFSNENNNIKKKLFIKLINALNPNINVFTNSDVWNLFRKDNDKFRKICLLLGVDDRNIDEYIYYDNNDCTSYRIPEIFDENKYEILSDYGKKYIDKKRVKILNSLGINITIEEYMDCIKKKNFRTYIEKVQPYINIVKQIDKEYLDFLNDHKDIIDFLNDANYPLEKTFQACEEKIKSINLLTNCTLTLEEIENELTCLTPGMASKNGRMDTVYIILYPNLAFKHQGTRDLFNFYS